MRKNLLASVTGAELAPTPKESRADYASRGASRSMRISIDEMAESAKMMIAGETIVNLDTALLDESFLADRLEGEEERYVELRDAIREHGQLTPILVRPHPETLGRYMIVFGRRRARAARELKIPVRAVVKEIETIAHIIAQGQENTARANLSFIEKALFAKKLLAMGQTKETIKSALTIDDTLLSRMLSVAENIPTPVIEAIGAAKSVGRDRWEELKKLLQYPKSSELAMQLIASNEFQSKSGADRFDHVLAEAKASRRSSRAPGRTNQKGAWAAADKSIKASYLDTGRSFSLSLTSKDASAFGRYISSNLESLYRAFKDGKISTEGGE
jgi:ParB family transcriptional regulator, chromosome partitioning protein